MAKAAQDAGIRVTGQETIAKDSKDLAGLLNGLRTGAPGELVAILGASTSGFFRAYEAAGWNVPVTGRFDIAAALAAVSAPFREAEGLSNLTAIAVFTPLQESPEVQDFVAAYQAHYGLVPTQRSFFVHEAVYLVVDAIRRAGSDQPAAIEAALKTTTLPSRLGGSYAPDAHNHAHTPLQILGLRGGKPAVIATE